MNETLTHLDLYSGIGGFALALADAGRRTDRNVHTIAFCEQDEFCQQVLKKHWPDVPIFDDVKTIPTDGLGRIDLVTGGFPCQPWSIAGKREGAEDKEGRDLWPAMVALVEKLRPRFLLGENVRGFVNEPMGLERSLSDLESIGYEAVPFIIPACSKNAPHRRDRVWIVAKSNVADTKSYGNRRVSGELVKEGETKKGRGVAHVLQESVNDGQDVADSESVRIQGHRPSREQKPYAHEKEKISVCRSKGSGQTEGTAFSRLGGTFDGLSTWVDADWERGVPRVTTGQKDRAKRLKALGNAIVPQVASEIFQAVLKTRW